VEVLRVEARVAQSDELRAAAGGPPNVPRDGDAALPDAEHKARPLRPQPSARARQHRGQARSEQALRQPPQMVVAQRARLERQTETMREREQLIVVALAM